MADAPKPRTVVVGGGIGGCTAALALHKAGADVTVYEQAPQLLEIGAGINVQAVAIGVLVDLGIGLEMLTDAALGDGIRTSKVAYYTTDGVFIADEDVGLAAGAAHPQLSVHRAKFHNTLIAKCKEVLGEDRIKLNHIFTGLENQEDGSIKLNFISMTSKEPQPSVECDFLVGADGLKSLVRTALHGHEHPRYTGKTIYRGLTNVDHLMGDGSTVMLCGNEIGNFIAYPISDSMRQGGTTHCNWGWCVDKPEPGVESWTQKASIEDIREELGKLDTTIYGGLTPLQIAEKTETIIGWALFDRDPLESFDYGNITLIGDAAHPLLPFGSQGATQAIMDAEALGICYQRAMDAGRGVRDAVKEYSGLRAEVTGKVVIANRDMGPTAVLKVVNQKCAEMSREEKVKWCEEHGREELTTTITSYRASMPKSVRVSPADLPAQLPEGS